MKVIVFDLGIKFIVVMKKEIVFNFVIKCVMIIIIK